MIRKVLFAAYLIVVLFVFQSFGGAQAETGADVQERVLVSGYGEVTVVDPAIPEVVASIKVKGGVRNLSVTGDGKKALVLANARTSLYVVDTLKHQVIDEINLTGRTDNGLLDRRVWGSAISPDGTKAYAFVTQGEKRTNIFKALPSKILEIDLGSKEVVRSVEAPYGIHVLQFKHDDPNTLFVWGYDLYTLDVKTMKLAFKQGIKHPQKPEDGSGNFLLIWPREQTGFNSFPLIKTYPDGRVTEGLLWFNMKTAELKTLEFDREPVGMFSAVVDPDEQYGYVVLNRWYKVDMKTGRVLKESQPPTGSTYAIDMSLDRKKLYLAAGGNDFIVANTDLQVERVIKLPTDGWDFKVVKIESESPGRK